jgi:hypothetical protein
MSDRYHDRWHTADGAEWVNAKKYDDLHQWICFIYNTRGQLADEPWAVFKTFCEARGLHDDVRFERLPHE